MLDKSGTQDSTVLANDVPATFEVVGKYVTFQVDAASLGIRNYMLTGAPNAVDMTGGRPTPVFASKLPDHRGLKLTSELFLELTGESIAVTREGTGLIMKIQAKDCAIGGVFQMEVERADETNTEFTHTLAGTDHVRDPLMAFYFDNRNFRNREGDSVLYKGFPIIVPSRINFGNRSSAKFVGRDSPQGGVTPIATTRIIDNRCTNLIATRTGAMVPVLHCGGVSVWSVASGGRMGMVFGEDATEVAPPATICLTKCQAQNRVRGQAVVLGFPFPVLAADKLQPRFPTP